MPSDNAFRFAVGEPAAPRSAVWRIWAMPPKPNVLFGDVYVAARTVADLFKVSLHASGVWRYAITEKHAKLQGLAPEAQRSMHRWKRPPARADGTTVAFRIHISPDDLRVMRPTSELQSPIVWVQPPKPGLVNQFTLLLAPHKSSDPNSLWAIPVGGEWVVLLHEVVPESEWYRKELPDQRRRILDDLQFNASGIDDDLRLVMFGVAPDGSRFFLDAAIDDANAA